MKNLSDKQVIITYRDERPDGEGRRHFLAEWENRGQVSFTQPEIVKEYFENKGFEVIEKN